MMLTEPILRTYHEIACWKLLSPIFISEAKTDFEKIITKLQKPKQQESEESKTTTVNVVFDRSKEDLGALIKLTNLQKRLNTIQ